MIIVLGSTAHCHKVYNFALPSMFVDGFKMCNQSLKVNSIFFVDIDVVSGVLQMVVVLILSIYGF